MTRLKLIKKLTSDWFDSHKFVNQVYWGDFIRWYADKQIQHSSVVITPIRVTEVTRSKRAIQLQITYADRVYSDFRNLDEVHSDADRTLADFVLSASNDKELRKYLTGLTSGNIEYFTNRTGDLIAGATMSVSLNVFSDANSCEIPVDFAPQPTPFECLDANYIVQYEDGTLIEQGTIPSGGSVTVEVPDIPTCQDANYTLTDSLGNVLDSGTIASGGSATITAPDAIVNVNQSDGTLIASVTAPSGGVEPYNVADSTITVNSDTFASVKATDSLDVPVVDSNGDTVSTTVVGGEVQVDDLPCGVGVCEGAMPMVTGQESPILASNSDAETRAGRGNGYFLLNYLNPFGTNQRFTGITGGYYDYVASEYKDIDGIVTTRALAFPDDLVCGWHTKSSCSNEFLMYREKFTSGNQNWFDIITYITAQTDGGFSDWRPININEGIEIHFWNDRNGFPMFQWNGYGFWTGNYDESNTDLGFAFFNGLLRKINLTSGISRAFMVRTANTSELTI